MNAKTGGWKYDEKLNICTVSSYLPTRCILITREVVTSQWKNLTDTTLTKRSKLTARNGKNWHHESTKKSTASLRWPFFFFFFPKMYNLLRITFKENQLIFFTSAFLASSLTLALIFFLIIGIVWDPRPFLHTRPCLWPYVFPPQCEPTSKRKPFPTKIPLEGRKEEDALSALWSLLGAAEFPMLDAGPGMDTVLRRGGGG